MSTMDDPNCEQVELGISPEFQAEIQTLARKLPSLDYFELLGIERDAENDGVRDGFVRLSKTYHPDRYFRLELGPYQDLLKEIYKRVVEAHEVLRDPKLRSEYAKTLDARKPAGPSLRARSGLRSPHSGLDGLRRQLIGTAERGSRHFERAQALAEQRDWVGAAAEIRLAVTFAPSVAEYRETLGEYVSRAHVSQLEEKRAKARRLLKRGDVAAAAVLLEEAWLLVPTEPELACEVSELVFQLGGHWEKACEFAQHAVSLDEKNPRYRKALARAYKALGTLDDAQREFQRAWELDPMDKEVQAELRRL